MDKKERVWTGIRRGLTDASGEVWGRKEDSTKADGKAQPVVGEDPEK